MSKFQANESYSTTYTTQRNDCFDETTSTITINVERRTKKYIFFLRPDYIQPWEKREKRWIYVDDDGNEYIELFHRCNITAL